MDSPRYKCGGVRVIRQNPTPICGTPLLTAKYFQLCSTRPDRLPEPLDVKPVTKTKQNVEPDFDAWLRKAENFRLPGVVFYVVVIFLAIRIVTSLI